MVEKKKNEEETKRKERDMLTYHVPKRSIHVNNLIKDVNLLSI